MIKPFLIGLTVAAALGLAACGGGAADTKDAQTSSGSGPQLSLVAYSTPQVVYDELIPAFEKATFKTSFGASGDQSRAVEAGLKADVVTFSIEPDMARLKKAGLVDSWQTVSTSVVSFIVRKGNPKNIKTWDDLLKDGVEVLTPNPFTSGAAKWNLLGAVAHGGLGYVEELLTKHVKVQDKSGREALQTFLNGKGDVLLSYEYEGVTAQKKGEEVDIVVPPDSLQIDILIAKTKSARPEAQEFIDYVVGPKGQKYFAGWGYDPPSGPDADVKDLKTIDDLGGWSKVNDEYFDPEKGSIAKIEEKVGVATDK